MFKRILKSSHFWISLSIISLVAIILLLSKRIDKSILIIEHIAVSNENDVKPITSELVLPILYSDVKILEKLSGEERKRTFIDVMLPAILIYRHRLQQKVHRLHILQDRLDYSIAWSKEDSVFVSDQFKIYKTQDINELLKRMQPPPVSLCLAQAALESGWGSSRFFVNANNVFGIWSFNRNESRIIASEQREGEAIYLKKYSNLLGSVEDYHHLLASSEAYSDFRDCIERGNNVFELIWYLRAYSEKRDQYVAMLRNVIVSNDLTRYDSYKINPEFFDYPPEQSSLL